MKNRKDELHKIYDKVRLIGPSVEYFLLEAAKRYVQANKMNRRSSIGTCTPSNISTRNIRTRRMSRPISSRTSPGTSAMERAAIRKNGLKRVTSNTGIYDHAVYEGTSVRRRLSPEDEVIARRRLTSPR